jgi:hypothetical protein
VRFLDGDRHRAMDLGCSRVIRELYPRRIVSGLGWRLDGRSIATLQRTLPSTRLRASPDVTSGQMSRDQLHGARARDASAAD